MKHSELLKQIKDIEEQKKTDEQYFYQQKIKYLNNLMLDNEYWVSIKKGDYEQFFTDYDAIILLLIILIPTNLIILIVTGSIYDFPHFLTNTAMIMLFGNVIIFILTFIKNKRQIKIIYHKNNKYLFVSKYAIKKDIENANIAIKKISRIKKMIYKLKKRDLLELLGDFMAVFLFMAFCFTICFIDRLTQI